MTSKKKFTNYNEVKTGEDVARFSVERGAEVHEGRHGTKVVFPGTGSFLVNTTKELSKSDKSHFRRLLRILGVISVLGIGFTIVAITLQLIANAFGYQIVWF